MNEIALKMLGISGSPIEGGNVETLLKDAISSQQDDSGLSWEIVRLSELNIGDCRQCNWCLKKQTPDRYCGLEDDMQNLYPKIDEADIIILATPVYFGRLSGYLATMIDRLRVYIHGNISRGMLRNKVGASIVVAWFRLGGWETAIATLNQFFFSVNMVIAAPDLGLSGAAAFSSLEGAGKRLGNDRLLVLKDDLGVASARSAVARAMELSRLLKVGQAQKG